MASIPEQVRAVDPYASYNSNVVNKLTGIVTRGSDVLDYHESLEVAIDSTSPTDHVVVSPGIVFKDDMLINITESYRIDFTDISYYVNESVNPFNTSPGIYYIVLQYSYVKSRPAPQAKLKILRPSQTSSFRAGNYPELFFLKAVNVLVPSGTGIITDVYDYDPLNTNTKREYVDRYTSTESLLPSTVEVAKIIYVPEDDQYYFGYEGGWAAATGISGGGGSGGGSGSNVFTKNTSGFALGDVVYVTSTGNLAKANGNFDISSADGIVSTVGFEGEVTSGGVAENVKAETSITISVGDKVYLSQADIGTITNVKPSLGWQFLGRCINIDSTSGINILFTMGEMHGGGEGISISGLLDSTSWVDASTYVYQEIDISDFNTYVVPTFWDSTGYMIQPLDFEFYSSTVVRVHMPSGFADDINYLLVGSAA